VVRNFWQNAGGNGKMKKLPIGIQTFEKIINEGYYYVDKTPIVKKLEDGGYYFLSRPRRFGKSLFLDTLKEAFLGNKELFEGLYISDKWNWNKKYPVIQISFASGNIDSSEKLTTTIKSYLADTAKDNQLNLEEELLSLRFKELIKKLCEKYGEKVVVLIDEYDKAILDAIEKTEAAKANREILKDFYSVLKDADPYLKLVFITGVSKFSKVSLFSGLNNLNDITLDKSFATICGYTQHDLETVFNDCLKDQDFEKIKEWYNGYKWLGEPLYNPFDILLFIQKGYVYDNYWFSTGTPEFLLKLIEKNRYYLPNLENIVVDQRIFNAFNIENIEFETLMWQTGYLTIDKAYESPRGMKYILKIPNKEVEVSLFGTICSFISRLENPEIFQDRIYNSLLQPNFSDFEKYLESLFASIPYNNFTGAKLYEYEGYYTSVFYTYLKALGAKLVGEDVTNKGRIDLTLKMPNAIFIFEFKADGTNALSQIKEKAYHQKYLCENKDIYLVGIEFSAEQRNVSKVEYEKVQG